MNNPLFDATERIPILFSRSREMKEIGRAIYQSRASCRVVFIYGLGGMGKSRLAEEVLLCNWKLDPLGYVKCIKRSAGYHPPTKQHALRNRGVALTLYMNSIKFFLIISLLFLVMIQITGGSYEICREIRRYS